MSGPKELHLSQCFLKVGFSEEKYNGSLLNSSDDSHLQGPIQCRLHLHYQQAICRLVSGSCWHIHLKQRERH